MKHIILVPDGMGDYPLESLGDRTPLEIAKTPNMDLLAREGFVGTTVTLPPGLPLGSDVGNLAILGYDPREFYVGRGPLEAANMNITLNDNQIAFRCNVITVEGDTLIDYSSGHISNKEAAVLIKTLQKQFGDDRFHFYPGMGYRHLLVITATPAEIEHLSALKCTPPHDIMHEVFSRHYPKGRGAEDLIDLMIRSHALLDGHDINMVRIDLKENPANMIWLWGQGRKPSMPTFDDQYGLTGALISAVDLVKGLGKLIGFDVINVPGATGYYDTNYEGKAQYGIKALIDHDVLVIHVEASDEAGHNGDVREKISAIERFDSMIVGAILNHCKSQSEPFRILVMPDHFTPVGKRTHTADRVPYVLYGADIEANEVANFSERSAREGCQDIHWAYELMGKMVRHG